MGLGLLMVTAALPLPLPLTIILPLPPSLPHSFRREVCPHAQSPKHQPPIKGSYVLLRQNRGKRQANITASPHTAQFSRDQNVTQLAFASSRACRHHKARKSGQASSSSSSSSLSLASQAHSIRSLKYRDIESPFYPAILLACSLAFPALSLLFIILPLLILPLNLILNLTNAHAIALAEAN